MRMDTYNKATDLIKDIGCIEKQINEVAKRHHWIVISTPDYPDMSYSIRFQRELVEWLSLKKEEYQKEFDELT